MLRRATAVALGSVLLVTAATWELLRDNDTAAGTTLKVYCAAGLQRPVAAIVARYQQEVGDRVEIQFGGSGSLLSSLQIAGDGDLFLPADESYLEQVPELVRETLPLASMQPVLVVRAGNPHGVAGLADLLRDDLRVGLANPDAAAVGRVCRTVLTGLGMWQPVAARVKVLKPTVSDLLNDVLIGSLDVAVVWNALLEGHAELQAVTDPALDAASRRVVIGVLSACARPAPALRLARYLAAVDRGAEIMQHHGFQPIGGDPFQHTPELRVMGGAMLHQPVEEVVRAFAAREGARIDRIYNGCGILLAQIKTGQVPDVYFACDEAFLTPVAELFGDGTVMTDNTVVIAVLAGNPKGVHTLADLGRPGLRVGLASADKSALGARTARLLQRTGAADALRRSGNVVVESPTADYLATQLRTGALDAAVVYRSTATAAAAQLEAIAIDDAEAVAVQPFAISRHTAWRQLALRLRRALVTADAADRFRDSGFGWRYTGESGQ